MIVGLVIGCIISVLIGWASGIVSTILYRKAWNITAESEQEEEGK